MSHLWVMTHTYLPPALHPSCSAPASCSPYSPVHPLPFHHAFLHPRWGWLACPSWCRSSTNHASLPRTVHVPAAEGPSRGCAWTETPRVLGPTSLRIRAGSPDTIRASTVRKPCGVRTLSPEWVRRSSLLPAPWIFARAQRPGHTRRRLRRAPPC